MTSRDITAPATRRAAILLAGTALAAICQPAQAQTWDGSTNTDYLNPENWTPATLPVFNSGVLINTTTNAPVIGAGQSGNGGTISVGESGTGLLTVQAGGDLVLGDAANGGALNVGGSQTTNATGGNGRVVLTGAGSTISAPRGLSFRVAQTTDSVGLVEVLAGGVLSTTTGDIGTGTNANGTVTISGAGSRWDITSGAAGTTIGNLNTATARGTLNVLDGGVMTTVSGVGWNVGQGGAITVSGSGSQMNTPISMDLRGSLTVAAGGSASFNRIFTGGGGATTITVTGTGSTLTVPDLSISPFANNATTITVSAGGRLLTNQAPIASINGSATATVTVTGADSLWQIAAASNSSPGVGAGANSPTLNILAGGKVESLTGFTYNVAQSANVLLSGSGSTLELAGNISIGSSNQGQAVGSFAVENGARLITHGASDNGLGFGVQRAVTISGGSSWIMDGGTNAGLQIETATLTVDHSTLSAGGVVSIGQRFGGTTLLLDGANFNARALSVGTVTGNLVAIGALPGDAPGDAGTFSVGTLALNNGNRLVINHNGTLEIDSQINGGAGNAGAPVIDHRSGTTVFTGSNGGYGGRLDVSGGVVVLNGSLGGHAASATFASEDLAMLAGSGTFGGDVTLGDAVLSPGDLAGNKEEKRLLAVTPDTPPASQVGTLTIAGDLRLDTFSTLAFDLGQPSQGPGNGSDLIAVGGDLVLDGTLDITDAGGFGAGLYRLINYGGTLTNNGLEIGVTPAGFAATGMQVDLATAGQVNLLASAGDPPPDPTFAFVFWDGSATQANGLIDGGTGSWTVTNTNWTTLEGNNNGVFDPATFLIFRAPEADNAGGVRTLAAATPSSSTGLVTVDNAAGQVTLANGVQFAATGYTVTGGAIALAATGEGGTVIRVGDGTEDSGSFVATIESALTGTSGLTKTDFGTLILSGANTYAGGTRVNAGTLQGTSASLQGAINVAGPGTLLFSQTAAGTYAGVLSGSGDVLKQGAGVLTLGGNSAGFAGAMRLEQGGIALSGQLGGTLTALAGTTLSGTGTLGSLDLAGTLAPGNSIGTLSATGDVVLRDGATYHVELAANGTGDRLSAAGSVTIEGGTVAISLLDPETAYIDGTEWVIASSASNALTGTFDGLTENSAFLDFALGYTPGTAFITLDVVRQFPDVALTFNQRQASLALRDLDQARGTDALAVYNALLLLDAGQARAAFDLSSGEIYADVVASTQRAMRQRLAVHQLDAAVPGEAGWQAWSAASLLHSRVDGDGNGARFVRKGHEVELGADYHAAGNAWAAGFSAGYAWNDLDNAARGSSADLDGLFATVFGRKGNFGAGTTVSATLAYAEGAGDVARSIAFPGITRLAQARVDSHAWGMALDARYGLALGALAIGPVAGIEHSRTSLGSYAESGAGALNLASDGATDEWARYSVGGFASLTGPAGVVVVDLRYAFDDQDSSEAGHRMAGSVRDFRVLPARADRHGLRAAGSAELRLGGGWSLGATAAAFLTGNESTVQASAQVRLAF